MHGKRSYREFGYFLCKLKALILFQVIITNQTATKMVGSDGSAANFDTGAKGLLVSAIGIVSICIMTILAAE
jgi:hypothetical protein